MSSFLIRGCLIQVISRLDPIWVQHLFKREYKFKFLFTIHPQGPLISLFLFFYEKGKLIGEEIISLLPSSSTPFPLFLPFYLPLILLPPCPSIPSARERETGVNAGIRKRESIKREGRE